MELLDIRPELIYDSAFSIVARYQDEYRGTAEYYRLAYNLHQLSRLQWIMERSLTDTLAPKISHQRLERYTAESENGPDRDWASSGTSGHGRARRETAFGGAMGKHLLGT